MSIPKGFMLITITILLIILCIIDLNNYSKSNRICHKKNNQQHLLNVNNIDLIGLQKTFNKTRIVYLENIFNNEYFHTLANSIDDINDKAKKRTSEFIQLHRKAGVLTKTDIDNYIDNTNDTIVTNLYYNTGFINLLSNITGLTLQPTDCDDKVMYNILIYDKQNDFINWHYDPSYYTGNYISILLSIRNSNSTNTDLSSSILKYKDINTGVIHQLQMKPNSLLVFDGTKILHTATGIKPNEIRIVLTFTYCDVCKEKIYARSIRKIKEAMFY